MKYIHLPRIWPNKRQVNIAVIVFSVGFNAPRIDFPFDKVVNKTIRFLCNASKDLYGKSPGNPIQAINGHKSFSRRIHRDKPIEF